MNEYLHTLHSISQSSEPLLTEEHNSLEIQESATSLGKSVELCIAELRHSANRLKPLVEVALNDLHHAEDVWNSKPIIAKASKQDIWEHLGNLSGADVKILILAEEYKAEAVEIAQQSWEQQIEKLRVKWFIDAKGQPKKGVGWGEKEGFIEEIRRDFETQFAELCTLIKDGLNLVHQSIDNEEAQAIRKYIYMLNTQERKQILINLKSANPNLFIDIEKYKNSANNALSILENKIFGDIRWKEVVKFKDEFYEMIESIVNTIIEEKVELLTELISQKIEFYNDFLERQQRYKQETPEQREAEKNWIDKQRQKLEQLKYGIEAIVN